jgi:hypothetical protein
VRWRSARLVPTRGLTARVRRLRSTRPACSRPAARRPGAAARLRAGGHAALLRLQAGRARGARQQIRWWAHARGRIAAMQARARRRKARLSSATDAQRWPRRFRGILACARAHSRPSCRRSRRELDLEGAQAPEEVRRRLLALPGIGPWTADYVLLRALGEPDAFPAGDLGLRRALGQPGQPLTPRDLDEHAKAWQPWRGYAALLLWTH